MYRPFSSSFAAPMGGVSMAGFEPARGGSLWRGHPGRNHGLNTLVTRAEKGGARVSSGAAGLCRQRFFVDWKRTHSSADWIAICHCPAE